MRGRDLNSRKLAGRGKYTRTRRVIEQRGMINRKKDNDKSPKFQGKPGAWTKKWGLITKGDWKA